VKKVNPVRAVYTVIKRTKLYVLTDEPDVLPGRRVTRASNKNKHFGLVDIPRSDSPPEEIARFKRRGAKERTVDKLARDWDEHEKKRIAREKLSSFEGSKREDRTRSGKGIPDSVAHGSDSEEERNILLGGQVSTISGKLLCTILV
jgi:hypothetical protein